MNKKLFASAILAVAAFVSTGASAAVSYYNSVTLADGVTNNAEYAQDANAKVAAGGAAVAGNVLIIKSNAAGDIPKDATIIVRLPDGLNFDGNPTYLVSPATPTLGLTLKDGTEFKDPTLTDPGITLFDTNGDGGMDRAVVEAGAASGAGDVLVISVKVKANSGLTSGVKKASLIVNSGLAVVQNVAEVVSSLATPVGGASGTALTSVDQTANAGVGTSTAVMTITIPKGTLNGKTITLVPQSGVKWGTTASSTITYSVLSPVKTSPLTPVSGAIVAPAGGTTATVTLTVQGGNATTGLASDVQVAIAIAAADSSASATIGTKGVTVGGTAGVSGTAALFNVLKNGSSVSLAAKAKATDIVAGSSAPQALPAFVITENFDGDAFDTAGPGLTSTITITAGTGLTFTTPTISITDGGASVPVATLTKTNTVMTLTFATNSAGTKTISISGLMATASSTASGALTMTVGSPNSPDKATAPSGVLTVANAVPVGAVTVTAPKALTTGPGVAGLSNTLTLTEGTYGAITTKAATQVQDAYIRVTPSANSTITAVTVTPNGYPAVTPTFTACVAETNVTTGAFLCEISAESTSITAGTSTVSVNVVFTSKATAAIGDAISVSLDGNAGVSGSVTLANVGVSTSVSHGVVPDLTPGDTSAQSLATLTIKQKFANAISAGSFRLIAPAGVTFNNVSSVAATASAGSLSATATVSIADTFAPSDTLVIPINATATISFTAQAVIGPDVSGWVSFSVVDGDINGLNKTNITGETVMLAYADGTLGAVSAGSDAAVNVNFAAMNAASGGLAPYTAASSDSAVATVSVKNSAVTVVGKSVGSAIVTVTDELGGSDTYVVTVSAGATVPDAVKTAKAADGSATTATFKAGASKDGGDSFDDSFNTTDDVTIVGTVNVDGSDQGKDGEIHVVIQSKVDGETSFAFLNSDGDFEAWDLTVAGLGAQQVAAPLGATYDVIVYSGKLAAGTYRVALAYSTDDGKLIYTGKAITITITE